MCANSPDEPYIASGTTRSACDSAVHIILVLMSMTLVALLRFQALSTWGSECFYDLCLQDLLCCSFLPSSMLLGAGTFALFSFP